MKLLVFVYANLDMFIYERMENEVWKRTETFKRSMNNTIHDIVKLAEFKKCQIIIEPDYEGIFFKYFINGKIKGAYDDGYGRPLKYKNDCDHCNEFITKQNIIIQIMDLREQTYEN